jgi:hypothetical protein
MEHSEQHADAHAYAYFDITVLAMLTCSTVQVTADRNAGMKRSASRMAVRQLLDLDSSTC